MKKVKEKALDELYVLEDDNFNPETFQKQEVTSVYIDTKNNIEWNTVNRGTWYNEDIFLYLMTQNHE